MSRGGAEVTLNVMMTSPTIGGHILSVSSIEGLNGCTAATYDLTQANICMDECGRNTTNWCTSGAVAALRRLLRVANCGPHAAGGGV